MSTQEAVIHKMLEDKVSEWIDERCGKDMSKSSRKSATKEILRYYEEEQEWDEGNIMTSGASVVELNAWLESSSLAVEILDTYYLTSTLISDKIMRGLGYDKLAISDAVDTCVNTLKHVMAYAQHHGYKDDAMLLDIRYDNKLYEDCFVDMVSDLVDYSYDSGMYDSSVGVTARIIDCCYGKAGSLLENTRLCQELDVTFSGYGDFYVGESKFQLACDEGTYEDFGDNISDIFDRLSAMKQETRGKGTQPIERD